MEDKNEKTMKFDVLGDRHARNQKLLLQVYSALQEKGYNPINQIVGYLLTGDPAYITNHKNARNMIRRLERDEILEDMVKRYLDER